MKIQQEETEKQKEVKAHSALEDVRDHGGNGAAQGGENDLRRWWGYVEYITSRKRGTSTNSEMRKAGNVI